MSENRKSSQARIDANRRYMEKTYKKLQVMVKPADYEFIDNYCNNSGVSKAQLIVMACREYIEKISHDGNNVPIPDEIEALKETQNETELISHNSIDWD